MIKEINVCPNCGATMTDNGGIFWHCEYCGSKINKKFVDYGNIIRDPEKEMRFLKEEHTLIFHDREELEMYLDAFFHTVSIYSVISLASALRFKGLPAKYVDTKWVWTQDMLNENPIEKVHTINRFWLLKLPEPFLRIRNINTMRAKEE